METFFHFKHPFKDALVFEIHFNSLDVLHGVYFSFVVVFCSYSAALLPRPHLKNIYFLISMSFSPSGIIEMI